MLIDLKDTHFVTSSPSEPGYICEDLEAGLRVVIRSRRNPFIIAFVGLWLGSWIIGAGAALVAISQSPNFFEDGLLGLWVVAWCAIGLATLYVWLWQLVGREILTVSCLGLTIRKDVLGLGRTRRYDPAKIQQLRAATGAFQALDFGGALRFLGFSDGNACFTYENGIVRFGASVEEEEAFRLVERIKRRLRGDAV